MNLGFADLHIHSVYSDGTLTPEQILRIARERGVELLSVCDHNVVEGTLEAAKLAPAAGLKYVTGVEIDAMLEGADAQEVLDELLETILELEEENEAEKEAE